MRRNYFFCAALLLLITGLALGDDQKKAEKELHKVTAMATDPTGRRVVSITVADTLEAKRRDLVMERRSMNINYGDLFIASALVKNGVKLDDISAQLKAGKKMAEIANSQHIDWKQLAADAKKLNAKVEDNLYKHFINSSADTARDVAEGYDPTIDGVTADNDVSKDDIDEAQRTYLLWKGRADKTKDSKLDAATEKSAQGARGDPVRAKAGSLAPPKY
ncbi:MAG TPA: hypothetical protein VJ731_08300 [Terriglobales bacterium]|nr:hypothetical protein [Terriglobales bacterium]